MFDLKILDSLEEEELNEIVRYIFNMKKKKISIFDEFLTNYDFKENKKYTTENMYKDFKKWCEDKKIISPMKYQFKVRLHKFKQDNPDLNDKIEI